MTDRDYLTARELAICAECPDAALCPRHEATALACAEWWRRGADRHEAEVMRTKRKRRKR